MTLRLLGIIAEVQDVSGLADKHLALERYGDDAEDALRDCIVRRFVEPVGERSVRLTAAASRMRGSGPTNKSPRA